VVTADPSLDVRATGTQRKLLLSVKSKDLALIEELYEAATV